MGVVQLGVVQLGLVQLTPQSKRRDGGISNGGGPTSLAFPCPTLDRQHTAYDVTVINPLQSAEVSGADTNPGHALNTAQKRKLDKSWEECHRQGIET